MRASTIAYRYRIEPTAAQEAMMLQFNGARRWVWNWALARKKESYAATGKAISTNDLSRELTILRVQPETAWLEQTSRTVFTQSLRDLDKAFAAFFAKRAHYPKFKSKKTDRVRFRMQDVVLKGSFVQVPKIGLVRMRLHRPIVGTFSKGSTATFSQDSTGHWYASFTVEQQIPERTNHPVHKAIGIDMGLKSFLVGSDGRTVENPRYYRTQERKLRRAQQALARKQKGSNNRNKARRNVARTHEKIRNQRNDFLHKLSTDLVREYDLIAIEDLSVKGLARTKLAKSVLDAGWSTLRTYLTYKADRADKYLMVIGRFYPSSRLCPACGLINSALTLADRVWTCDCGAIHDRDLNAAQNILTEGLHLFNLNVAAG